jgi:type I restriction enzyme M protein
MLTWDNALRQVSILEEVEVRGTVWLMGELLESGVIDVGRAESAYDAMRTDGSRLPWKEVAGRKWTRKSKNSGTGKGTVVAARAKKKTATKKKAARKTVAANNEQDKSIESWIWDAACSIRGAKDAAKYKDFILPLIFTKRLCDVFDDELNRIAKEVGSRKKAFQLVKADHKLVRFYLPLMPEDPEESVWSVIRKLADKIGEQLTTHLRDIAKENPLLQGIIDRVDFNATTHGQRDLDDDRLSNLVEAVSTKRLGLDDVEPDIIGKSYEYLIRKFAEGSGQSAGEFYTPPEVGLIMAKVMDTEPGLLIKCEIAMEQKMQAKGDVGSPLCNPID